MLVSIDNGTVYVFGKGGVIKEGNILVLEEDVVMNLKGVTLKPITGKVIVDRLKYSTGEYEVLPEEDNNKKLALKLILPNQSFIDDNDVNLDILRLFIKVKEIPLLKELSKWVDAGKDNEAAMIEYNSAYIKSKNKDFIPELSTNEIRNTWETAVMFNRIFKLRNEIYNSRNEKTSNHIVFGINNPIVWLDAPSTIKRIACGAIQYRKGLHIREFDLMVYNLRLTQKYQPKKGAEYAALMRDLGLL